MTSKKSPNVYKSCPQIILLEKLKILTPLQKLPNNANRRMGQYFVDDEGTKCVKQMILYSAITGQFIWQNRR